LRARLQTTFQTSNNDKDAIPIKSVKSCSVNFQEHYKLEDVIESTKTISEYSQLVHISNDHDFLMDCFSETAERIYLLSYNMSLEKFLSIFENTIGKIFFKLTVTARLVVAYNQDIQLLMISIKKGLFASSMKNMLSKSLMEEHSVKLNDYNFPDYIFDTLKMEDRLGHVIHFTVEDLNQINLEPILPSLKRIFFFPERFSPNLSDKQTTSTITITK